MGNNDKQNDVHIHVIAFHGTLLDPCTYHPDIYSVMLFVKA